MKKKKEVIGFWGHFDKLRTAADGQTVRTQIIYDLTEKRCGEEKTTIKVSSYKWKRNPIGMFFKSVSLYFKSDKIIILPANKGRKVIVPLFNFLHKFKKKKLYCVVIGGFFDEFLAGNPKYVKYFKKYEALFVQTKGLMDALNKMGLDNVFYLTNIKMMEKTSQPFNYLSNNSKNVCTLSRVSKTKGISEAIHAVKLTNEKSAHHVKLDVYGVIEDDYKEEFLELVEENKSFVKYCGVVESNKTAETLSNYYALLFPTYFKGEGFPGTVLDAYFSGTPIIATDWRFNGEFVKERVNGCLVPIQDVEKLSEAIIFLLDNKQLANEISKNNLLEADNYTEEKVMKSFYEKLEI